MTYLPAIGDVVTVRIERVRYLGYAGDFRMIETGAGAAWLIPPEADLEPIKDTADEARDRQEAP